MFHTKKSLYKSLALACCTFCISGCNIISSKNSSAPLKNAQNGTEKREKIGANAEEVHYAAKQDEEKNGVNDPVLLKINGQPSLRKADFLTFAEQAIQANPYLANFGITSYDKAPEPIKQRIFDAMVQQKLIEKWGDKYGISDTKEFQENLRKMISTVRQALISQTFEKQIMGGITVSEADVKAEYENNRERFVREAGSICVQGVCFASKDNAEHFYKTMGEMPGVEFVDHAENAQGGTYKDFGVFSQDPRMAMADQMPAELKRVALSASGEAIEQVRQGDDKFWVLRMHDRKDPVYYELAEIATQLEQGIKAEKFKREREQQVQKLRGEFTIDIDMEPLAVAENTSGEEGAEQAERPVSMTL